MTIHEWRHQFLAELGVNTQPADWIEFSQLPMTHTQPRVPSRYAHAVVTNPHVRGWLGALAKQAVADRQHAVASVTTGSSLILLGATGTGKTYEAWGAIRCLAACDIHARWQFVSAPDMYAALRPRPGIDSESVFREYATAGLLVVDDLGVAKNSEWVEDVNYRLVNHRYGHQLPTVFTSNVPVKELAGALGDRVSSRLNEMCERVVLKGEDRRYATPGATAGLRSL